MKSKINFSKASTILAIITSIGSLYIVSFQTNLIVDQFNLQRQEQYMSVFPYVSVANTENEKRYGLLISNTGIGPAMIDHISIHYKDSIYHNHDFRDAFVKIINKEDSLFYDYKDISHTTLRKGTLIPANKMIEVITLKTNLDKLGTKRRKALRNWFNQKLKIEIIYSSIYGEKWKFVVYRSREKIKSLVD